MKLVPNHGHEHGSIASRFHLTIQWGIKHSCCLSVCLSVRCVMFNFIHHIGSTKQNKQTD